jgi:hypothetical protein
VARRASLLRDIPLSDPAVEAEIILKYHLMSCKSIVFFSLISG